MVRGSATVDSVCVRHPALDASTDLTVSVTITPVFVFVGSSAEVSESAAYDVINYSCVFCVELVAVVTLCVCRPRSV